MWIEAVCISVIIILVLWIYLTRGGTMRTRELENELKELKSENEALKETNEALRSGYDSSRGEFVRSVTKASRLIEELVRVRGALMGSKSAKEIIERRFSGEIEPRLIRRILSSENEFSAPLKRRLAREIFVGSIGREVLKGLNEGKGLNEAIAESGVPLRVGRERVRTLKKTGYLDRKLNLTEWGNEVLES